MLFLIKPSISINNFYIILPAIAAILYGLIQVLTRKIGIKENALTLAFYFQLNFFITSLIIGLFFSDGVFSDSTDIIIVFLFRSWIIPSMSDVIIFVAIGFIHSIASYYISEAYCKSEASFIAPFEYFAVIMAVFWSFIFLNEKPTYDSIIGILIMIFTGSFIIYKKK